MGRMQRGATREDYAATVYRLPRRAAVETTAPLASASVAALLRSLRDHHGYSASHSETVVELARRVATTLDLLPRQRRDVEHTALLHDVGKVGIPAAVLEKPGSLSEPELRELRLHPEIGARLVCTMPGLWHLAPLVRASHERWDGCGYPDGLRGERIPLVSRIVFACDAYDAMTSERSYGEAVPPDVAMREIAANAGTQFCPASARALIAALGGRVSGGRPRWQWPDRGDGRRVSRC